MRSRIPPRRSDDRAAVPMGRAVRLAVPLALAALLSACGGSAPLTTYDLTAPKERVRGRSIAGQVVIGTPAGIQLYQSDRIVVKDAEGVVSYLPDAQWADQLPNLLQARMVEAFENTSHIKAVSRPGDGISADYQLNTTIRAFQVAPASKEVSIDLAARLVGADGKVVAARIFTARAPAAALKPEAVVQAFDRALAGLLLDVVRWIGSIRTEPAVAAR